MFAVIVKEIFNRYAFKLEHCGDPKSRLDYHKEMNTELKAVKLSWDDSGMSLPFEDLINSVKVN